MVGGEYSLKITAPQLLQFGIDSVLKILNKRITEWMNDINYKGVYRTAPATLALLISQMELERIISHSVSQNSFIIISRSVSQNSFPPGLAQEDEGTLRVPDCPTECHNGQNDSLQFIHPFPLLLPLLPS